MVEKIKNTNQYKKALNLGLGDRLPADKKLVR